MKYANYIRLEVLTPVHIGSGDTSDPLDYVIDAKDGIDYFCQIDLEAWLEDYPEQEELTKILDRGNLAVIRKYIAEHLDADIYTRNRARILSADIAKKYQAHIANTGSPNQLLIDPALKNPLTGGLLIPGSSLKGAIRTAVIDFLDQQWNLSLKNTRNPREYTQVLERALGTISDNAFKQLKVGDFEATNSASAVVTAKEKSIKPDKTSNTPKNSCQVCLSTATEEEAQEIFGRVAIGKQCATKDAVLSCSMNGRTESWNLAELMQLVNSFYKKRYINEKSNFYNQPHFAKSRAVTKFLDAQFESIQPNQMILRVGHYSHIESMTITNNKPMGKKGFGKTRTLANGIYPFGWVKLTLCSEEEYLQYQAKKASIDAEHLHQRQQLRQAKIAQRQLQLQQQLQKQQHQAQLEQQRLDQEIDERNNPWKQVIRQIENLATWGDLKQQVLEDEQLAAFRDVVAFSQAIYQQAILVRKAASKWDDERDKQLSAWLAPANITWASIAEQTKITQPLDEKVEAEIEKIQALKDWGGYLNSEIILDELSTPALQELLEKFALWGCDNKKAKKDKKAQWNKLKRLVNKK